MKKAAVIIIILVIVAAVVWQIVNRMRYLFSFVSFDKETQSATVITSQGKTIIQLSSLTEAATEVINTKYFVVDAAQGTTSSGERTKTYTITYTRKKDMGLDGYGTAKKFIYIDGNTGQVEQINA